MAMCFLVQQLRLEKKVDICSVVRKLRSQRMGMLEKYVSGVFFKINSFVEEIVVHFVHLLVPLRFQAQYEFLHRAIVNYADLHKLSLESLVVSD